MKEYVRFALTGALNTAVDFGVFNLCLIIFGEATRGTYVLFKSASFIAAVVNSYFWNKYWVFKKKNEGMERKKGEKTKFFLVSVAGFAINVAGSLAVFSLVTKLGLLSGIVAANIGALAGTLLTQVFNFIGYKFIVFKPHE